MLGIPLIAPLLGAAMIGAGGVLASSIGNWFSQKRTNKDQFKYNKKLAEMEFAQNKQMWNLENMYNSPSAQMARYQAAGINPNTLYGQGSEVSSGNTESMPELDYPAYSAKAPYFDAESPIQALLAPYQMGQLQSQTAENYANAGYLSAKEKRTLTLLPSEKADLDARVMQTNANTALINVRIDGLTIDNDIKRKTKDAVIRAATLQNDLTSAKVGDLEASAELKRHEIKQVDKSIEKYDSEIKLIGEQAAKTFRERTTLFDSIEILNASKAYQADASATKLYKEAEILTKECANWETMFNAKVNKMATEMNLSAAQTDLFSKKVKNYVWENYVGKIVQTGAGVATAFALKGMKNPGKMWTPGNGPTWSTVTK